MNFLAHCLLAERAAHQFAATADTGSPDQLYEGLVGGGFCGDFIKGAVPATLPDALALGVRLHRRVDAVSNVDPGILTSCNRFPKPLRRFAPIFVDLIADHLLACQWSAHHEDTLPAFTANAYLAIGAHKKYLSADGHRLYRYMVNEDLLSAYVNWEAMERALLGVTRRLDRPDLRLPASEFMQQNLAPLEHDFADYFPRLNAAAISFVCSF